MNTNTPALKAKIRHLCSFLVLCLHLAHGAVPGPCKHSVTKDHLLNLRRLIGNQLENGCSITYNFTERQSLSEICYIKAAFPHILDLLNAHFRYGRDSDNYIYTSSLKNLIYDIYSQKCIPPINEETEDNPVKFAKLCTTSPRVGLEKAEEVIQMYMNLVVTKNDKPVKWNCENEFAEDHPESTTTILTQTSVLGTPECRCSCSKMSSTYLKTSASSRSSLHAPTTLSLPGLPQESVLQPKNDGSKVSEPAVKHNTSNSIQPQPSPVTPNSEPSPGLHARTDLFRGQPHSSAPGNFPNLNFPSTPDLIDDSSLEMEGLPSSVRTSPTTHTTEVPRISQRRTALVLQSATSQPSQRSTTSLSSERSTALVIAKRSLDDKGILSDFYSELLQSWITTTTSDPAGTPKKGSHLQTTPGVTANGPFQTLHVDKNTEPESATALPTLNRTEDVSEYLSPRAEQAVDMSIPTQIQTHLHMAASLPENVIKALSEATDCKDSECKQDTGDSRDHAEGLLRKDFQLTSGSILFLITSVCLSLLLITALLFCKQQTNMRQLLQRPRGPETQRSIIYGKMELQNCGGNTGSDFYWKSLQENNDAFCLP